VPGLGSDTRDRDASAVCLGGVASAERVAGDPLGVGEADSFRACFEQPTEGMRCEPPFTGRAAAERNEHPPRDFRGEELTKKDRQRLRWMVAAVQKDRVLLLEVPNAEVSLDRLVTAADL